MKRLYISGYRSFEFNIFAKDDPKLFFIKKFLEKRLLQFLDEGGEWLIITGQLGVELWAAEVAFKLQEKYPELKVGVLLPYEGFGNRWNEQNQFQLQQVVSQADYAEHTSSREYISPKQLVANQVFCLRHTDSLFIVYDEEFKGSPRYLYDLAKDFKEDKNAEYIIEQVRMDELDFFVNDYVEENELKDK